MSAHAHGDFFRTARRLVLGTATLSSLGGAFFLMRSWGLLPAAMMGPAPGRLAMEPTGALALLLLGLALWLRAPAEASRHRHLLGNCGATLAALLGLSTLAWYILGVDLGLERLLHAGRIAPNSAICFVLLGLALLLLGRRVRTGLPWTDLLVLPTFLIALVAFNGHLHGALSLADPPQFPNAVGMSLPAVLGVLLLGTGILAARPEQGLATRLTRRTLGGIFTRLVLPSVLVGPLMIGIFLELLHLLGVISARVETALFSTAATTGGFLLILFSAGALDRLDAERRQATAALEASSASLRGLLDSAPDPVVTVDRQGLLRFVSVRTQELLGHPRETLVGQPVAHILPEHAHYAHLLEPGAPPPSSPLVLDGLRRDGTRVTLEVTFSPFESPEGWVLVCMLRDITARRELEQLKEEYVSLVSHDLRNPLHTISLRVELLLRQLRARELEKEAAAAEIIQQGVRSMGGMIAELLEGARLESGRVQLQREPLELGRFLLEVLERSLPPAERERFRLESPSILPPVLADAPRVERVVVNLLTNALKYSPAGSPVELHLARQDDQAVVSVRDQGPGLRPAEVERLFQKYYRTRDGEAKTEGLGLGLYISRLIIEAHGGRIWVESTPGQGATFSFSLPLALPQEGVLGKVSDTSYKKVSDTSYTPG